MTSSMQEAPTYTALNDDIPNTEITSLPDLSTEHNIQCNFNPAPSISHCTKYGRCYLVLVVIGLMFSALLYSTLYLSNFETPPKALLMAKHDTSGWVGAEYQPSKSSNEDWLWHYDNYREDVIRELTLVKNIMGFTALRVFLHSKIYFADPSKLISVLHDLLTISDEKGFGLGFVFFDDCWNHTGLNLSSPCKPVKGKHNGCWKASPQMEERNQRGITGFMDYVKDIVQTFKSDPRVLWWEIFNEPKKTNNYSTSLRHAAFHWALEVNPSQPVISCWDEALDYRNNKPYRSNTQLNDHHQYFSPWNGIDNKVFQNTTGLMQGGIVTEAGARWYQGQKHGFGSPLTVIDWLTKLRANPKAPFVPGVMIDWEVMVSNSNTRWQWTSKPGNPEPAIPWHQHIFPNGSPVSYTEAAAIRRYVTGEDDFLCFEDFLRANNPLSEELYRTINDGDRWIFSGCTITSGLIEMSVWPFTGTTVNIAIGNYGIHINSLSQLLELTYIGEKIGSFSASSLENGILSSDNLGAFNILRVLVEQDRIAIWLNPMYPEAFIDGQFPLPGEKSDWSKFQPLPARIDVSNPGKLRPSNIAVSASNGNARLDYISVLPPILYDVN